MIKTFVSVIIGAVIGAAVTLAVVFGLGVGMPEVKQDIVWFEQPGSCMTKKNLRVLQVVAPNKALVGEEEDELLNNPVMFLVTTHNANFYEEQVFPMPAGKCARHVGNFNLETKDDGIRIIPVVTVD